MLSRSEIERRISKVMPPILYCRLEEVARRLLNPARRGGLARRTARDETGVFVEWPQTGERFYINHPFLHNRYVWPEGLTRIRNQLLNKYTDREVQLESGDTVVEAGANVGEFTTAAAMVVKQIYAFDPDPDTFRRLSKNTASFANVHVFNEGLGNTEGEAEFFISHANSDSGIYPLDACKQNEYIYVMAQSKAPTLRQFQDRFPTEDSCLDHLLEVRYAGTNCPKCDRPLSYSRVKGRRSYQCAWCANQLYPTAGTPFDRTRTSLRDWFYVMFLFTTTRNGVAAKRVQRELGVTYKTAWRMCDQIRSYMSALDSDDPLGGPGEIVEIDEAMIGGKAKGAPGGRYAGGNKTCVLGMLENGGEIITRIVPNVREANLLPVIHEHVRLGSHIHTDALLSYRNLGKQGYRHSKVRHQIEEWVGSEGQTVNRIEGFWSMLKRGINGTHIHVSAKHLPKYLGEFEYRWNMRQVPHLMLDRLMHSFAR